jgi:hypothetical protein
MAVRQQKHSHHMDKYDAHSEFWQPVIGMLAAVMTVVAMLGAGACFALTGHENLALAVISGTGIVTVAGVFLQRKKSENPEPPAPARPGPLTRRQKRERAAQTRKNIINR